MTGTAPFSTEALIRGERQKLEDFAKEAQAAADALGAAMRASVNTTLQHILKNDVAGFGTALQQLVQQMVSDALGNVFTAESARASGSRGRLALTGLQNAADLLNSLERAKRNV